MYPLPRMLITAGLFVAVGFGMIALFFLPPWRAGVVLYYVGFPVVVFVAVMLFAGGEPSDQTPVHVPRTMSDAEFNALEDEVDRRGHGTPSADAVRAQSSRSTTTFDPADNEDDFVELVREAIDELPPEFARALDHVGVVVSDQGAVQRINGRLQPLYGLYIGYGGRGTYLIGAPVRSAMPERIVIFRDTLVHDFGHDPNRLREEVTRTLRHEVAHHFGWDEPGVRELGL